MFKPVRNQSGTMLLAMITFVLVFSIMMMAFDTVRYRIKNESFRRLTTSKDILTVTIGRYAKMASSIRHSIDASTNNTALKNCVTGGGCITNVLQSFILYGPMSASPPVGGTNMAPVLYDMWGKICTGATDVVSCPFQVITKFRPRCDAAVSGGCPNVVDIFYRIERRSDSPAGPSATVGTSDGLMVTVQMADILKGDKGPPDPKP